MGSKSVTTGYRYYMGVHFGLTIGEIDSLNRINVGDREAFYGPLDYGMTSEFQITAPDLFGGETKEGGIEGTAQVLWGGATQTANPYLSTVQTGPQPGYRGVTTFVYRGLIACMNPYPKPWSFQMTRILKGWSTEVFYESVAVIDYTSDGHAVKAMNPAHIIYQCITDTAWGMGYPITALDEDSFTMAASTLYDEGFGLCLKWNRQDSIESFIQIVADHVGGVVANDRLTGKFRFDLIRNDYSPEAIPILDTKNVIELRELDSPTLEDSINELTVVWHDPLTNKDGSLTLHSLAGIQAQNGRVISERRDYPGLAIPELAARVGMRDLKASSSGLKRVQLKADRSCYSLIPGTPFVFDWPPDGVHLVMRVGSIDYGTLTDGSIEITAIEDVFGLPSSSYVSPQDSQWEEPDSTAEVISQRLVFEASYRDCLRTFAPGDFDVLPDDVGFIEAVAMKPTSLSQNFDIRDSISPAPYVKHGSGDFCAGGFLATALIKERQSTVFLTAFKNLDLAVVPGLALIGTEQVKVTSIDLGTGEVTFDRGAGDTVPQEHALGTTVFICDNYDGFGTVQYLPAEEVDVKLITKTPSDALDEADAPVDTVIFASRKELPYPPGKVEFDGEVYPTFTLDNDDKTLTWVHRDRVAQGDTLVGTGESGIGPEAGTTYTVETYDDTDTLIDSWTGITGTSQVIPGYAGDMTIKLWSVRDGYDSLQRHVLQIHWPEGNAYLWGFLGALTSSATATSPVVGSTSGTLGGLQILSDGTVV